MNEPTTNPVLAGDKTITGSVTLNQPIPAGTTFTVVVTLPDGTEVTVTVAEDGIITVDLGDAVLQEGDIISIVIVAHNGDETKASSAVSTTILAKTDGSNGGNNGGTGNGGNTGDSGNGVTIMNYGNKTYGKFDTFPQAE